MMEEENRTVLPQEPETLEQSQEDSGKGNFTQSCFEWMDSLGTAVIIVVLLFTVLIRVPEVIGPSMLPNLEEGDRVVVSCLERNFEKNDIVVVEGAGTELDEKIIKRVIATEGQEVNIDFDAGVVYVDGEPLDESSYIENGITTREDDMSFPQTVPEGCVFVLGDNREVSLDSRDTQVGMIDCRHIIGKVKLVLLPFDRFGAVKG